MPTIKLTDAVGLDVDVETDALSSLAKYAVDLSKLSLPSVDLKSLADLTLASPSITSIHAGVNFDKPVDIGLPGVSLDVDAGLSGSVDIFVPPAHDGCLFDGDVYGEPIPVDANERYVSLTLSASVGPELGTSVNQFSFGFSAGATVTLANYRKFSVVPAAPKIVDALTQTVAGFTIPGSPDDLRAMPADTVVVMNGTGTLGFTADANLFAATNPLATLKLPSPLPALDVSAGGSVSVSASCEVTLEYQLRIRKTGDGRVTLGFYRKHGTETSVTVGAKEGIAAGIKGTDLFSRLITAISKNPSADFDAMKALGVPDDQRDAIGAAVKKAAQRKLEVSLLATLTTADSHSAAFLYEFDMAALDSAGAGALSAGLHGDLRSLTSSPLPTGVRLVRSILTDINRSQVTWKINLLGIYNFLSTSELVRQGKVAFDGITGDLVITDKATAERIGVSMVNFGADSEKLRSVMAESFLITAVYQGSQTVIAPPEISCSHSYFAMHASTDSDAMLQELTAATGLELLDAAETPALLANTRKFGRTMVHAETSYSAAITPNLFLNGSNPKPLAEFDKAGRDAMRLLVRPNATDGYRLRGLTDDDVWGRMRDAGQFNFQPIFPDLTSAQIQVIATDYSVIAWWANAMSQCAQSIAAMLGLLAVNPNPESAEFKAKRTDLAKKLAEVTNHTKAEFGQPWGLLAMDIVCGRRAAASVQLAGSRLTLERTRKEALAGAANR